MSRHQRMLSQRMCDKDLSLTPVASGAMGHVYRLDCAGEPKSLTLKILHGRHRNNDEMHAAMAREFFLLQALGPGPFPQVKDHMHWRGRAIVSYQYIDGESLLHALARGAIDKYAALDLGIALMEILARLHEHELAIVHSDISPENLLVDRDGCLHLIDFGGARSVALEQVPRMPGKPSYMSPEQAQGRPWTMRSDLYQAGVVLFELLTGRRYNPETSSLGRRAFSANPVIDLDKFVDVPLRAIMRRLLDINPGARWRTARACKGALLRLRDEYNAATS